MPKKTKTPSTSDMELQITLEYERWREIYNNGSHDPNWEDGMNLDLVRNHICYARKLCDEYFGDNFLLYPDSYFYPLPVEVPYDLMTTDREVQGEFLTANKTLCYTDAVRFDFDKYFREEEV